MVHLATHVLKSSEQSAQSLIALSLTPRHENEVLPPQEIAGWRTGTLGEAQILFACGGAALASLTVAVLEGLRE